ncbi:hypothetical protein LC048_02005 [Mesobacillus subterraneus]|uniref:hypothetical protein n=1 Tax=Mesobacillus subterraneus TaxID=285983 RepID=UPI001CFDCA2F|nr:hypothetical protein [Mesobacillus subterraneus]WLR55803.1 hypothetical protein LC048_02005 [Mesobacillus subterraneus]
MNYITIGRFTLPTDLLAAFAAIFIGALIYRIREKKSIDDWYWNSFFIYIAIYKISYAIFNFKLFIDTPLSLLYFNGGTEGQILAFLGIAIYLYWLTRKKGSTIKPVEYLPAYFIFFLLYWTGLFAFSQDFLAAAIQAVLLVMFLLFYVKNMKLAVEYAILFLMLEALILSLFSDILLVENLLIFALGIYLIIFQRFNKEEVQH